MMTLTQGDFSVPVYRVSLVKEGSINALDRPKIREAKDVYELLKDEFEGMDREKVVALFLNSQNLVLGANVVSIGNANSTLLRPREVLIPALAQGTCTKIILAHNHPSGSCEPSEGDILATHRIAIACEIMGITLLDHLILGETGYCSLFDEGHLTDFKSSVKELQRAKLLPKKTNLFKMLRASKGVAE